MTGENRNINQKWEQCLAIIRDNVSEQAFKAWFSPLKPVSLEDSVLKLSVPSDFYREYIEENYINLLGKTLQRVFGPDVRLVYNVSVIEGESVSTPSNSRKAPSNPEIASYDDAARYNGSVYAIPGIQKLKIDPELNPRYSFDNFIEGECNRLGRAAGVSISVNPGKSTFNPLFIYGGPGLGKTHLAQAIGLAVKDRYPEKIVLYVNANTFLNQYMNASCAARNSNNSSQIADFIHFYQQIDVLIIDDVQEFADKKGTQNAFFHIFDYLHRCGKQLVLTSDRPPVDLQGLEHRLLSRFKWGLSAELLPPGYETRVAILKSKCSQEGVGIAEDVIEYLAHKVKSNVRELEGIIVSLIATSTFSKKDITIDLAKDLVEKIVNEPQVEITIPRIQNMVCNYFNVTIDQFMSKTRKREIVQARQIAMYLSRNLTKTSLSSIGAQLGGKDHATVLHACNTVCDLIDTDRTFRQYVSDIEKQITSQN